jgi:hypothetical protein
VSTASTEDTLLEDDGLAEAEAGRRALLAELRRVAAGAAPGDAGSLAVLFRGEDAAAGVRDLANWALHVLQMDRALVDRRVAEGVRKALGRREDGEDAWVFGESDDEADGEGDAVWFDAQCRTASDRELVAAVEACRGVASAGGGMAPGGAAKGEVWEGGEEPQGAGARRALTRVATERLTKEAWQSPRKVLPPLKAPPPKLNIWAILKDAVGKDLSKISIPVALNEPISFLQRLAEDIEYSELLDEAAAEPDQHRRLLLVATMVISHYSSTQDRIGKPFNPLQGETFSLVAPGKGSGVRFLAEQVSHHPPVSACYAEGSGAAWKYYNAIEVKNKFWGKSLEVFPTGWNHVEIPRYGDHYEFEQVTACVHNIFLGAGKMWLDNYGDMEIVNRATGDRAAIKFQKSGMFSDPKSLGAVTGVVYDAAGAPKLKLSGRWSEAVYEELPRRQRKLLWQAQRRPPLAASNNYNMTGWAITLNQPVAPGERARTAPTDSRLRPDQRALEGGAFDAASLLKAALEDGQRARRSAREAAGVAWAPRWFTLTRDPASGREEYLFNGRYFAAEADGAWAGVEDMFACAAGVGDGAAEEAAAAPEAAS